MRHLIKRAIALILSVTLTTMVMSSVVVPFAEAVAYGINFINASDKLITTIVENAAIQAEGTLPPGHAFDAAQPFVITGKDGSPNMEPLFNIKADTSGRYYTITALDGSAGGSPETPGGTIYSPIRDTVPTTYTLKPKLFADISDGLGMAKVKILGLSGVTGDRDIGIAVKSKTPIRVTSNSSVKLTVKNAETESVAPTFEVLSAGDVTGAFTDLKDQTPLTDGSDGYKRVGNNRSFKIRFSKDANVYSFDISLNADEYIQPGTTFEFNYNLQEINALTLTVITPRRVLENIHTSITNSPTDPKVTDGKTPYINTTDNLFSMRSTFSLLKRIKMYNDTSSIPKVSIEWQWKPTPANPLHDGVVQISTGSDTTASVKISPQQEDVKGLLVATPSYKLDLLWDGKESITLANIPAADPQVAITTLGSGSSPLLRPTYKIFSDATDGHPVTSPMLDTTFPANMVLDVYNNGKGGEDRPFEVGAQLRFGKGYGRAEKVIISSSKPSSLDIFVDNSTLPYSFGSELVNIDPIAGSVDIKFVPKAFDKVDLTFTFMVKDSSGKLVEAPQKIKTSFTIEDSTPLGYAEFSNIQLISSDIADLGNSNSDIGAAYPSGRIEYGFKSETTTYDNIKLPYVVEHLNFKPFIPTGKEISNTVKWRATGLAGGAKTDEVIIGTANDNFDLSGFAVNATVTVSLTATAQNGKEEMYILKLTRQPQDGNSALGSFSIKDTKSTELLNNFVPTIFRYDLEVPYSTRWVRPSGKTASLWAKPIDFYPPLVDKDGITSPLPAGDWLRLTYPSDPQAGFDGNKTTTLKTEVTAQDNSKSTYTFNITRKDPSTNDRATALVFRDKAGKELVLANEVKFDKDTRQYDLRIPYSLKEMTVEVTAEDAAAIEGEAITPKITKKLPNNTLGKPMIFRMEEADLPAVTEKTFDLKVGIYPESGAAPVPYVIRVTRNDPDNDNYLATLKLQDQDKNPITSFSFNPLTPDYVIPVPYKAESVTITPTTRSPLARVEIDGIKLDQYTTSHTITLKPNETKVVSVKVFPENLLAEPPYREYTLTITRALPSTDARLVSLKVTGGEEFLPLFDPNKTAYSVTIPEGTASITVTAEPKDKAATLLINGEGVTAGQPSGAIAPIDAISNVPVVVTAEDGKTKMTYNIKVTNRNLIPKSTNADLKSLTVNYGDMSPRFKPSITDYQVAVKNDASSVDILPVTAIAGSTVEVFKGTRKLGDYSNNYSAKLEDGENEFSIKITAEEGKVTKTYDILVYRKDEELQGKYKPTTPDMVDYEREGDIIVDITKYPIVSAEVFNTLKTDYPDKSMIFEGNDYSLTIRGKDLNKLIPHDDLFDLSLSFTSPLEDEVWEAILSDYRNSKVEPVFVHFNHHGALPAPMVLTLSLGRQYRNLSATWNYYNEERARIDFYGGVKTNSRGTFSLKLTHMSTYLFSDHQIVGAENKSGDLGGTGGITSGIDGGKYNPNTGAQ